MIGRPLREEAGLAAPVSPPDRDGAAPEPTPPELFGADAEGALDEVGAGEVLEQRGALACFAAEGMAGYGSGGGGKVSEAGGGTPLGSYAQAAYALAAWIALLVYRAMTLRSQPLLQALHTQWCAALTAPAKAAPPASRATAPTSTWPLQEP